MLRWRRAARPQTPRNEGLVPHVKVSSCVPLLLLLLLLLL
jgi:hypothetical protein